MPNLDNINIFNYLNKPAGYAARIVFYFIRRPACDYPAAFGTAACDNDSRARGGVQAVHEHVQRHKRVVGLSKADKVVGDV